MEIQWTHLLVSCGKDSSRKFYWNLDVKKVTELGLSFCSSKTRIILVGIVDAIEMAGRKQNMAPMWRLMKLVDLGQTTSFVDTFCWDALNVNANRTRILLTNTEKCSNHEFLLQQLINYQGG